MNLGVFDGWRQRGPFGIIRGCMVEELAVCRSCPSGFAAGPWRQSAPTHTAEQLVRLGRGLAAIPCKSCVRVNHTESALRACSHHNDYLALGLAGFNKLQTPASV